MPKSSWPFFWWGLAAVALISAVIITAGYLGLAFAVVSLWRGSLLAPVEENCLFY